MPAGLDIDLLRGLAGEITREQLRSVDCFAADGIGLFMPVGGACLMALTPMHVHPAYMFALNFDDRTAMRLRGEVIPGQHGRVFCLAPNVPHQELPSEEPPRYICAMIDPALFEGELAEYEGVDPDDFDGVYCDASPDLLPALRRFMVEAENLGPGSARVLRGLALEICHILIRAVCGDGIRGDTVSSRIEIDRAVQHMCANLARKVALAELAAMANMSSSHFSRVFRAETGRSPMDYLRRLRLDRAKRLLLADDMSITDVALACGLGSGAYLSACFRQHFNVTPSEYRERGRNSSLDA